jgi:hypothetical protein
MSLDGFIAGPDDNPGWIFDWQFNGDAPSVHYSRDPPFKLLGDDLRKRGGAASSSGMTHVTFEVKR